MPLAILAPYIRSAFVYARLRLSRLAGGGLGFFGRPSASATPVSSTPSLSANWACDSASGAAAAGVASAVFAGIAAATSGRAAAGAETALSGSRAGTGCADASASSEEEPSSPKCSG